MRRLLPPRLFLLSVAAMVVLHALLPIALVVAWPYRLSGSLAVVAGLAMAVWGTRRFASAQTNIKTFDAPGRLVTDGLFRITRNPMYFGLVVALAGASVLFGSLSPMLVAAAFAVVTDRWYIRFEEAAMARAFGDEYAAYCRTTRRWL